MFRNRFVLSGVAIVAALCLSGCGGGGTSSQGGGGSSTPSVTVTASATTVDATDTVMLTATVTNDKNGDGVTWSVSGGGTLSGQTSSSATYTAPAASSSALTVTVTATSVADTTKTATATLTVPAQLTITTTTTQLAGTVGSAYSVQLNTSAGISPYIWSLDPSSAALPTGWNLTSGGLLTGPAPTAGQAGTLNFIFDVKDSGTPTPMTTSLPLVVTINPAPAITFTGTVPATATYQVAYSGSAAATGGAGALTYSLASGSLPTGFNPLNTSTGAITGTPTALGAFSFTIQAADAFGDSVTSSQYTITVSNPAAATPVISPSSGAVPSGQLVTITDGTSGAAIYYTTNGSTPSATNGTLYSAAFTVTSAETVEAVAVETGYSNSAVASATYTLSDTSANNAYLNGTYVCKIEGFYDADGARWASLANFVADGSGGLSNGIYDSSSPDYTAAISGTLTGTYSIGAGNNGLMSITFAPSGGTGSKINSWAIALNNTSPLTTATEFRMVENDDVGAAPSGQNSTGDCYLATTSAFAASTISGNSFVFQVSGVTTEDMASSGPGLMVETGRWSASTVSGSSGSITNGIYDEIANIPIEWWLEGNYIGSNSCYTLPRSPSFTTYGRYTVTFNPGPYAQYYAVYLIDTARMFMLEIDPAKGLFAGDVRTQQQTSYTAANMNGNFVFYKHGFDVTDFAVSGYDSEIWQGAGDGAGDLTINASYMDNNGTYSTGFMNVTITNLYFGGGASYLYPGRATFYGYNILYLYDNNSGFVMTMGSTGEPTDWGWIEPQTATSADFTDSALAGTYMMGEVPSMQATQSSNAGEYIVGNSGNMTAGTSSGGPGIGTFDQAQTGMTLSWLSTAYGTFSIASGGTAETSCILISTTRFVCINNTDSSPNVQIMQQ